MTIRVKLMGMLRSKTPASGTLELRAGATVQDALTALAIPTDHIHLFMINGQHHKDQSCVLAEGDELMVMPPVGGG